MDSEDNQPRRPPLAVRFSTTMRAADDGVRAVLRWALYAALVMAVWRGDVPEVLSWLR